MNNFFVFDILKKEVESNSLDQNKILVKDKKELISNIHKLDQNGKNICYGIIKMYEKENEDKMNINEITPTSVEIDIGEMPPYLFQMILLFSHKHLTVMKEIEKDKLS